VSEADSDARTQDRPDADFIRTFPCGGCGAKLSFAPGTSTLQCAFCGTTNDIEVDDGRIEELPFDTYLKALEGHEEMVQVETVKCAKCGAEQTLGENLFASACTFCSSPIVWSTDSTPRRIERSPN